MAARGGMPRCCTLWCSAIRRHDGRATLAESRPFHQKCISIHLFPWFFTLFEVQMTLFKSRVTRPKIHVVICRFPDKTTIARENASLVYTT